VIIEIRASRMCTLSISDSFHVIIRASLLLSLRASALIKVCRIVNPKLQITLMYLIKQNISIYGCAENKREYI
jgi:hypothetical protein